jgi:hypothetical protein
MFTVSFVLLLTLFGLKKAFQEHHKAEQVTGGEQRPVEVGCIILLGAMQAGNAKR